MYKSIKNFFLFLIIAILSIALSSCSNEKETPTPPVDPIDPPDALPIDTAAIPKFPFDINDINDTYYELEPYVNRYRWGVYNVHDPAIIKDGDYYYCYSTDASFGNTAPPGIQVRRSRDLVNWQFIGHVFNGLPSLGASFILQNGGTPFNSLWAPYVIQVGDEFRLYYSLSSPAPTPRLSVIGLATSPSPIGPWTEIGLAVTSRNDNTLQTNAIDPSVIIDKQGDHWMYYGSAWDGIYILKLNPETGLAFNSGDKGRRIAQRGFTSNRINGNIEAPEIIYNSEFDKYYLFIAYDWLETKYNVRVGRADSPEGPFFDITGRNMNDAVDDLPMILAPYRFNGHSGWQGVSHPAVFSDGNQFYLAHQGRPGENRFFMILHVRRIHWTDEGWPIVSPQRYSGITQTEIDRNELVGEWEQIDFGYRVVPGYAAEQLSPDFQNSTSLVLDENGTFNNNVNNQWSYEYPWMELNWNNTRTAKVFVERERDWENRIASSIMFSGLYDDHVAIWGKKRNQ